LKFIELKAHIKTGALKPAYLITGDDAYLTGDAVKKFRAVVEFPDMNYIYMDGAKAEDADITGALNCFPVMSPYRVVTVEGFAPAGNKDIEKLKEYLYKPMPTSVLVLKNDKLSKGFNALMSHVEPVDCGKLSEPLLLKFIAAQAEKDGKTVTRAAAVRLISYCSNSLMRITTELSKLSAYCESVITDDAVTELVRPDLEYSVFELSESVARRQKDRSMLIIEELIADKNKPTAVLNTLYNHFRRLLHCSVNKGDTSSLPRDLGVKEYAVVKACAQAALFTPVKLKKINDLIAKTEFDIKSGKLAERTALDYAALSILNI